MKKATQIIGWIGAVILGLGLLSRLIQQQGSLFISLHLALGAFFILTALLANLPEIRAYIAGRIAMVGSGAFLRILLVLVLLVIINIIIVRNDRSYDLTSRSLYSLSGETFKILEQLPAGVQITAFFQPDRFTDARKRLELYRERSDRIDLVFVDPDRHPEIVAQKAIEYLPAGSILFECMGQSTMITQNEEADITNALIKVTREESPVIYFLTGHGEADIDDKDKAGISILADSLRHQNYILKNIYLTERVPEDAAALIIAGPGLPLQPPELEAIDYYITQGGKVLFLLDPVFTKEYQPYSTRLESFLRGYGIVPGVGVIVDPVYNYRRDTLGLSPLSREIREHPVTSGLENKPLVFFQARPFFQLTEGPEAGTWTELVLSSDKSYEETNITELFEKQYVHKDNEDPAGPFLIAAARFWRQNVPGWQQARGGRPGETRLMVIGNSLFIRNGYIETYSNLHFALNAINWLAGEERMIHLRPKKRQASRIYLTRMQTDLVFYMSVLILPEILMIVGVGIWWRKR